MISNSTSATPGSAPEEPAYGMLLNYSCSQTALGQMQMPNMAELCQDCKRDIGGDQFGYELALHLIMNTQCPDRSTTWPWTREAESAEGVCRSTARGAGGACHVKVSMSRQQSLQRLQRRQRGVSDACRHNYALNIRQSLGLSVGRLQRRSTSLIPCGPHLYLQRNTTSDISWVGCPPSGRESRPSLSFGPSLRKSF